MIYHRDYSLLIYLRAIIQTSKKVIKISKAKANNEDSSNFSKDSLLDIDESYKKNFY